MSNGKGGDSDSRPWEQLFGHVVLMKGIDHSGMKTCRASILLKPPDSKQVGVLTPETHLQTLLATGLATGNLVDVLAKARPIPTEGPFANSSMALYDAYEVTLHMKP